MHGCASIFVLLSLSIAVNVHVCVVSRLMWLARASGVNNIVSAPSRKRRNVAAALYYAVDHLLHYQICIEASVRTQTRYLMLTHRWTYLNTQSTLMQAQRSSGSRQSSCTVLFVYVNIFIYRYTNSPKNDHLWNLKLTSFLKSYNLNIISEA